MYSTIYSTVTFTDKPLNPVFIVSVMKEVIVLSNI